MSTETQVIDFTGQPDHLSVLEILTNAGTVRVNIGLLSIHDFGEPPSVVTEIEHAEGWTTDVDHGPGRSRVTVRQVKNIERKDPE